MHSTSRRAARRAVRAGPRPDCRPGSFRTHYMRARLSLRHPPRALACDTKWMKDPVSVQFRGIEAVQNSRGLITVCGEVNGRNSAGKVSISPFIGVLMGPDADADSCWSESVHPIVSRPR